MADFPKYAEEALEQIDAGIFSGDLLFQKDAIKTIEEYIGRWTRAMVERNPTRCYYDSHGSLRNADGSRSIFDDVDE